MQSQPAANSNNYHIQSNVLQNTENNVNTPMSVIENTTDPNNLFGPSNNDFTPQYYSCGVQDSRFHANTNTAIQEQQQLKENNGFIPPLQASSVVGEWNAKGRTDDYGSENQPYSYYTLRQHRIPELYGDNANPYIAFANKYFSTHEYNKLADYFLSQFYRVHQVLNKYVIEMSGNTHDVALDDTMIYDIYSFMESNDRVYPTPENGEILLSRFLQDKKDEYAATLKRIWDNRRICYEKLWTRRFPLPVSTRNEDYTPPDAYSNYQFRKPVLYRKQYLNAIGVGVPRNRISW